MKQYKISIVFYRTECGNEPVREWLKQLTKTDKKIIGEDLKTIQFAWPLGLPLVKSLGRQLWEVRSRLKGERIARIIFFMDGNTMILLHAFIKKSQKIPQMELDIAVKRKKAYQTS